ncbi:MAG: hypothetical protein LW816_07965, partial [Planctomyces sp.]|nr:hypothetical protein [Planctomyces sp.]
KDFFFDLTHEIVRLMSDDELFTFVIHPEADGTNNISERFFDRAGERSIAESGASRPPVSSDRIAGPAAEPGDIFFRRETGRRS